MQKHLNEYYDNPPAEALQAVNLVRARSGMPAFDNALTKDDSDKNCVMKEL